MKSAMKKTSLREIRHSLGRYLAIFSIVALGVIMFAGLKVCREDMVATADNIFPIRHYMISEHSRRWALILMMWRR